MSKYYQNKRNLEPIYLRIYEWHKKKLQASGLAEVC